MTLLSRAGCGMCGIPDVLYVDHGTDFTNSHISQAAIDLHVRIIHSTVARPQGRGKIERFYRTINTELLPTLPGHLAPKQRHPDPALALSQLDHTIGQFITTYNHREHRETSTSPHRAWVADGWLPRMPENLAALDGLLLHVARPRTVQRDGIHFQGLRYLAPTLATYVGTTVTIRYDPRDITEIRVFDHDTFICTAINEQHPVKTRQQRARSAILLVRAMRQAFDSLETQGRRIRPRKLRAIFGRVPLPVAAMYWAAQLSRPVVQVSMLPHATATRTTEQRAVAGHALRLVGHDADRYRRLLAPLTGN